jgi:hypothetical protein
MTYEDDRADEVELNPQVRWTEQGRERTFEFIWPEWHALQELARLHGWQSAQLAIGQWWSARSGTSPVGSPRRRVSKSGTRAWHD